jgi:hypothetical protein
MIKKLLAIALGLIGASALLFCGLLIYFFAAPLIERNAIQMVSGPYLDHKRLLGRDAHIDELWRWNWKAPLTVAFPRKIENCASSQTLRTAVTLELLTVDSLCNVSPHPSAKGDQVRCSAPISEDSHLCFASAYIGGLGFDWERQSFDQGRAQVNTHTYLREVTRMLVLDERVSSLSTSDRYSREFNGTIGRTPRELLTYVNATNQKLKSGSYAQTSQYEFSISYRWNYSGEYWELQYSTSQGIFSQFQEKFQVVVTPK